MIKVSNRFVLYVLRKKHLELIDVALLSINFIGDYITQIINKRKSFFNKLKTLLINNVQILIWNTFDTLVCQIVAEYILITSRNILLFKNCRSIRGNKGIRGISKHLESTLKYNKYFYKTDIHSYYSSINHQKLLNLISNCYGARHFVTKIVEMYLAHTKNYGPGISRGSSLAPLLAAIYLCELDRTFLKQENVEYFRYVDDILLISKEYNAICDARREVLKIINKFNLSIRPEKTCQGQVQDTFSFVGFKYGRYGVIGLAPNTEKRFKNKLLLNTYLGRDLIYKKNFLAWVKGAGGVKLTFNVHSNIQAAHRESINLITKFKNYNKQSFKMALLLSKLLSLPVGLDVRLTAYHKKILSVAQKQNSTLFFLQTKFESKISKRIQKYFSTFYLYGKLFRVRRRMKIQEFFDSYLNSTLNEIGYEKKK